jgi:transposase InsO family protein
VRNFIVPTPVPTHIMSSVALDIFSLPRVDWQGESFDSLLLCVDRLSGWVIARPTRKAGLTAQRAAHLIMDNRWETFGLPAIITSDQGTQFVGQWWRTMCARLGIRQGYSQAYRPQANGRAEVTGKTLIGLIRKVLVEDHINWVKALP